MSGCWGTEDVHSWEVQISMSTQQRLRWGREIDDLQVEGTYFPLEKLAGLIPWPQTGLGYYSALGRKGDYQGSDQTLFPKELKFPSAWDKGKVGHGS